MSALRLRAKVVEKANKGVMAQHHARDAECAVSDVSIELRVDQIGFQSLRVRQEIRNLLVLSMMTLMCRVISFSACPPRKKCQTLDSPSSITGLRQTLD